MFCKHLLDIILLHAIISPQDCYKLIVNWLYFCDISNNLQLDLLMGDLFDTKYELFNLFLILFFTNPLFLYQDHILYHYLLQSIKLKFFLSFNCVCLICHLNHYLILQFSHALKFLYQYLILKFKYWQYHFPYLSRYDNYIDRKSFYSKFYIIFPNWKKIH